MGTREDFLSRRFYDDERFPYGFSKSGCFTVSESESLESMGAYFKALEEGLLTDLNEDDMRVIKVLRGEVEASSFDEKTWLKYSTFPKRSQVWVVDREKSQKEAATEEFDDLDDSLVLEDDDVYI
ncbi:DUF413 domain-containing protein [Aliikangiella marina]|uniref:Macrodomain Ori protein n=1 Tax=Aliikangiella marina TaxID=1712262 RepID=A0A545TJP7_9GAMM|nr:DUF413 domain-containing protein [Aliikangiella marina]TQV77406.1 DUF413 domain-containing protein [Aliikangiella marina]